MKRNRKTLWICCLVLCLLLQSVLLPTVMVQAAPGASITFSGNTVKIGDTVTATVKFTGDGSLGALIGNITYDSAKLEYVSIKANDSVNLFPNPTTGEIGIVATAIASNVTAFTFTVTFQAKGAGTATVSAFTDDFTNFEGTVEFGTVSKNASVTVRAISKDATLKALSLDKGTLSPKFAAGTVAYTASVANNVSSVTVSATATDANAKVTGTGKVNLSVGKNTINVKVTAEDGTTTKTYTITVTRAAATPTPTKVPTPTKAPTPTKTPTPTGTVAVTTPPVPTEDAPTETPAETPVETPTGETTPGTTPETVAPSQPTMDVTTGTITTPPIVTDSVSTPTPTATQMGLLGIHGLFTVQAAFAFCAIGMFFVGGTVGFILCYVVKSKKHKK